MMLVCNIEEVAEDFKVEERTSSGSYPSGNLLGTFWEGSKIVEALLSSRWRRR